MKKIVPFSNDIKFNTKIYEITSISLEHNLKVKEKTNISGEFIISGEYKMTDSSVNSEPFIHGIPFDIALDSKYDTDKMKLDIDDFNFEIINDEILRVNISVLIDGVELIEMEEEIIDEIKPDVEIKKLNEDDNEGERLILNENVNDLFKEDDENMAMVMEEDKKEVTSIFNNFDDKDEKYVTYHVHIVRENDNLETICTKYKISKEEILQYNDLEEITLGKKIIIPYCDNEEI